MTACTSPKLSCEGNCTLAFDDASYITSFGSQVYSLAVFFRPLIAERHQIGLGRYRMTHIQHTFPGADEDFGEGKGREGARQ